MSLKLTTQIATVVIAVGIASTQAFAGAFINGSFENGTANGWTEGSGYRGGVSNPLNPIDYLPGGLSYQAAARSKVIDTTYVDANLGAALGSTVYSGNHSYRVEDTTNGGYASLVSQTVNNYTDSSIFFAWKAVLQNGGHDADQSAVLQIELIDLTTNTNLITRTYNAGAGGGGVDSRFSTQNDLFFTPNWQIEQLTIDSALSGHNFQLLVLAADCSPTGHTGYAYLDGFGAVTPPPVDVPEPASLALLGIGLISVGMVRRRNRA